MDGQRAPKSRVEGTNASEYTCSASLYLPPLKCSFPSSFRAMAAAICSSVGLHVEDFRRNLSFHADKWDRIGGGRVKVAEPKPDLETKRTRQNRGDRPSRMSVFTTLVVSNKKIVNDIGYEDSKCCAIEVVNSQKCLLRRKSPEQTAIVRSRWL